MADFNLGTDGFSLSDYMNKVYGPDGTNVDTFTPQTSQIDNTKYTGSNNNSFNLNNFSNRMAQSNGALIPTLASFIAPSVFPTGTDVMNQSQKSYSDNNQSSGSGLTGGVVNNGNNSSIFSFISSLLSPLTGGTMFGV